MSLRAALEIMLSVHKREMDITRTNTGFTSKINVTPASYSRYLEGPEELTFKGKEFVISRSALEAISFPLPIRKGDRLTDPEMGDMTIAEAKEMFDVGGSIMGYRVRTA